MDSAAFQDSLGPRYRIERELGRGGMATVYVAEDVKHGRQVALKVLHPDFAASLGPERFRREITLAARLQHPHILSVYDSGETATGRLWFTMPYVVGESLRERLRRERQLSVEDTIRITCEVADALQYAHSHGVVHRDVKPENIMLADGHAMLADFGVARSASTESTTITETGFAVGTPAYMSPEQASGERTIDGRSDQYSLAVVTYEMLAAEPPFSAPTPQAAIAKMLTTPPPSIRVVRKDTPTGIDTALKKALSVVPAARYASMADFIAALQSGLGTGTTDRGSRRTLGLALAGVGLVIIAAGVGTFLTHRGPAGPTMLAVLPFETVGDTADAWITDGITDEVRGKLASLAGIRVIARSSSNPYRHTTKRPEDIDRELGVRYLLMGRIHWASGTGPQREIRVEPELVQVADVRTPETKWEQPFDEQQSDVFKLQTDIAERVATALQIALDPAEKAEIHRAATRNPDAYMAYLRGQALEGNSVPDDFVRARVEFRLAVRLDSTFAEAWDALSHNLSNWAGRHSTTMAFDDSAYAAVKRALALEPDLPESSEDLALYYELVKKDTPRAYEGFRAALDRAPNNSTFLNNMARSEMRLGKWDSAVVHSEGSAQLGPRNAYQWAALCNVNVLVRHYDEAGRAAARATALNPSNILGQFCSVQVPLARGDLAATRATIRAASPATDSLRFLVFLASYGGYTWAMDSSQRRVVLAQPLAAFERGRATWTAARMGIYDQLGDSVAKRAYADSTAAADMADNGPAVADSDVTYARALALAGHRKEAIAAADKYMTGHPITADQLDGPDNAETALKAYIRAGANDKAIDLLTRLLRVPGRLTPGRIKLDPDFSFLRGDPRFQALISTPASGERL